MIGLLIGFAIAFFGAIAGWLRVIILEEKLEKIRQAVLEGKRIEL